VRHTESLGAGRSPGETGAGPQGGPGLIHQAADHLGGRQDVVDQLHRLPGERQVIIAAPA